MGSTGLTLRDRDDRALLVTGGGKRSMEYMGKGLKPMQFLMLNLVYNASLDKNERLKKAQEYEDSHTVDEDVVRALERV